MSFGSRRVVSFESRRSVEMAALIERHGGVAIAAPTMREVPLDGDAARALGQSLRDGALDVLILMTGVGTRALVQAIATDMSRDDVVAALNRDALAVVVRGPKPAAALREMGVRDFVTVPEPNTSHQIIEVIEARGLASNMRIAIQEHGAPSRELESALRERGASVVTVPIYRWGLPDDTAPLRAALHAIAQGDVAIALFTSRAQIEHLLVVARDEQLEPRVRDALATMMVGSIGPVCSEGLRAEGIEVSLEPTHPKMGHLVKECAEQAEAIIRRRSTP